MSKNTEQMPKSRKTKKYFSLFDFLIFGRMPFQLSIRNSFFQLRKLGPLKLLCQLRALLDVALKWPDGSAPTALASLLLEPSEPQKNGKKDRASRLFDFFACLHLLSSFLWLFPPLLFPLSMLSGV